MSRPKGVSDSDWREMERIKSNRYRANNREKFNAQRRDHYERNKDRILKNNHCHRYKDINAYNEKGRARRAKRPDVYSAATKRYREKLGAEAIRAAARKHAATQRAKGNHWKYIQIREKSDPVFLLMRRIRARINMAFYKAKKGTRKQTTTIKLLGCSFAEFKRHIESQFKEGMTWEKVCDGSIHIDHKQPISSYDLTDPLQQKAAFHFTNCQPLWAFDNISKGCRVIIPFENAA